MDRRGRGARWLATGGSDGRVITFELFSHSSPSPRLGGSGSSSSSKSPLITSRMQSSHSSTESIRLLSKIAAHDSSVTSLSLTPRFILTSGNDGRTRLFSLQSGNYIRELSDGCESVWKVGVKCGPLPLSSNSPVDGEAGKDNEGIAMETCVVMGQRMGKTVVEVWEYGASRGGWGRYLE
jgi:F-box and WD-40 domain protein CDC4